jgi:acetyl-CoA acetyltransferase
MAEAYVVGGAMIRMTRYPDSSYPGLAVPSIRGAVSDAGVSYDEIDAVVCGHTFGGALVAQRICKDLGLGGIPMSNVENACSGGATALHSAVEKIHSGVAEVVLVVGVDKLSQFGGGTLPMVAEDPEARQGAVMPAIYAMRAQRFLHDRSASPADLAQVSVQARRHGANNPYAMFQQEVTADQVLASRMIADPLTLLQCCPTSDGSAAVVVVSEDAYKRLGRPAARVAASQLHSGTYIPGARPLLSPQISVDCAIHAYEQASVGPEDLNLVELHDAFAISQLIYYEALQLCAPGDALGLHKDGDTTYGGKYVVSPSGGLLSRGHPVGATGVAQVVEMLWHLTGRAGARQVPNARLGMTHVTGGGISGFDHGACSIHILESTR